MARTYVINRLSGLSISLLGVITMRTANSVLLLAIECREFVPVSRRDAAMRLFMKPGGLTVHEVDNA